MRWGRSEIDKVAVESAAADYEAFETIGLEAIENAAILDMGCFDGFNTVLKFAPYENISTVVGIDPETEALDLAGQHTTDQRFTWIRSSAEEFDAPSSSFDVVYLSHVFQHVRDKEAVAGNAFRLLKPGGYIVIKTFDDSCKLSYPDPNHVMKRLFNLYETNILPHTEHTRYTDRNNGQKCAGYLSAAGFEEITLKIHTTDTLNKNVADRLALFNRYTYFRRNIPKDMPSMLAKEYSELLEEWEELFKQDNYLHVSNTFVITARKPQAEHPDSLLPQKPTSIGNIRIEPMRENDLGQVMSIELESFPDPWAPIAYAMEIRHNPQGFYSVARNAEGSIIGYIGWWVTEQKVATIMHIAVAKQHRRGGVGRSLLEFACNHAIECSCETMQLQVRSKNASARSFYRNYGFAEIGTNRDYYTSPEDDAVFMQKSLMK